MAQDEAILVDNEGNPIGTLMNPIRVTIVASPDGD